MSHGLPWPAPKEHDQNQQRQQRDRHGDRGGRMRVARRLLQGRDVARNRGPHAGDQQPVRIHAIRRAGHQRDAILARHDFELRGVVRFDDGDAVDPVSQRFAHHVDIEVTNITAAATHATSRERMPLL